MEIRYVKSQDWMEWHKLDSHLPKAVFEEKVRNKQGYVMQEDGRIIGVLRYNLFWENTPFCTFLFIGEGCRGKGYGKHMLEQWEHDMKSLGYGMLMTSTLLPM